jgi:creatinine amidohydrolase/Fe(II)-dependent formamide hydrolase-like protein
MPIVRGEELTFSAIQRLPRDRVLVFLPVSALEVHGPHLPLGMDQFMARWMAEECGRRFAERHRDWTVVQLPLLSLGADELPLAGSLDASARTVHAVLVAHGRSLARAGFANVVVTNGHGGPRHAAALEAACRTVSRRSGIRMFTPSIAVLHRIVTGGRLDRVEQLLGRTLTARERAALLCGEHAGTWETSFQLAERGELVDQGYARLGACAPPTWRPLAVPGGFLAALLERCGADTRRLRELVGGVAGGVGWLLNARFGYGGDTVTYKGDPSAASAEIGHAFRTLLAEDCLALVEAVCDGEIAPTDVRSIASEHALVQPYFLVTLGVVAAAVALLALLWAWL